MATGANDATPDWTAIVAERKIREAMDAGEFDNLEGEGKPLDLDEGLDTHQRLLNKLLKNSGALPEWVQLQKDLEREVAALAPVRERSLRSVRYARNLPSRERAAFRAKTDLRDRLRLINDLILKYNMIVPVGAQRAFKSYVIDQELGLLDAEVAALIRELETDTAPSKGR